MTTITAPAPQAHAASDNGEKPINLFQLGCLFVIRSRRRSPAMRSGPVSLPGTRLLLRGGSIPGNDGATPV